MLLITSLIPFLLTIFSPASCLDPTSMIGNVVNAVNNKYNTFSLVEYLMNDLEDYMGVAYAQLKKLVLKRMSQAGVVSGNSTVKLGTKLLQTNFTNGKNHSANSNLSAICNKYDTSPKNISGNSKIKRNSQNSSQYSDHLSHLNGSKIESKITFNHHAVVHRNFTKQKYTKSNNFRNKSLTNTVFYNESKGNHANIPSNTSHSEFIDRFLKNKILNYYKYLHTQYANTTYYGAAKAIVDRYFRQFKAEINQLKVNVTNDIKDMKSDLIKLYYETTSTTDSVDSLIIHYIENKTDDLETYVKHALHKEKTLKTTKLQIHTVNSTGSSENNAINKNIINRNNNKVNHNVFYNNTINIKNHFVSQYGRNNNGTIYKINPSRRMVSQNQGITNGNDNPHETTAVNHRITKVSNQIFLSSKNIRNAQKLRNIGR